MKEGRSETFSILSATVPLFEIRRPKGKPSTVGVDCHGHTTLIIGRDVGSNRGLLPVYA